MFLTLTAADAGKTIPLATGLTYVVTGDDSANTFEIAAGAITTISGGGGTDVIKFLGSSSDYTVALSGTNAVFTRTADGSVVTIPVQTAAGGNADTVQFGTGAPVVLSSTGSTVSLGAQTIAATSSAVTGATGTAAATTVTPTPTGSFTLTTSVVAGVPSTEGSIIQLTITPNGALSAATVVNPVISGQALGGYTATTNAADFGNIQPVTFAAGATTAQIVNITVASDTTVEGIEAYKIALLNSAGVEVATALTGLITDAVNTGNTGIPFTLTTGVDALVNFTGGAGNDTFTGPIDSWTILDAIDGGAGTGDILTVSTTATAAPTGATVVNVETMNVSTTGAGYSINTTTYTGLTALTVSDSTAGNVSVTAATTTTSINTAATGIGDTAVIGGGGVLTVTSATAKVDVGSTAVANAYTSITVTGGGDGVASAGTDTIAIQDRSGTSAATGSTLRTVTLTRATDDAAITANGLTTLNLTGFTGATTVGDVVITAAAGTRTLTVNLNGMDLANDGAATAGTLTTTDATATTLAVTNSSAASYDVTLVAGAATTVTIDASAALQLDALTAGVATVVNVSGAARTTITADTLAAAAVITSTSTGGTTVTQQLLVGQQFVGTASTGNDVISVPASYTKAITTGGGNDTVTYGGLKATGGSIDAGIGTDTVVMTAAAAVTASTDSAFNASVTGFEVLSLATAGGSATIDLLGINGVNSVTTAGAHTAGETINSFTSGGTLTQTASANGGSFVLGVSGAAFNAADVFNISLSSSTLIAAGSITLAGVETVNINVADASTSAAGSAAVIHTATLAATSATSIVVTGNNGLTLTNTGNVAVTNFNASGVVANGTAGADTDANLAVTFVSANTTVGAGIAITGGAGADVLSGSPTVVNIDTIVGGAGADTISGGLGIDFLTGGTGADVFTFVAAAGTTNNAIAGNFDTITDFVVGTDLLQFSTVTDVVSAAQAAVQTAVTGLGAGATSLQIANAMAANNATALAVSFATYGGDTYVLYETGAGTTSFTVADDIFIKLSGVTTIPTFANGVTA